MFISGNLLCVWTFNKKDVELKPSFANLLKCLSIFDTVFLVSFRRLKYLSEWSNLSENGILLSQSSSQVTLGKILSVSDLLMSLFSILIELFIWSYDVFPSSDLLFLDYFIYCFRSASCCNTLYQPCRRSTTSGCCPTSPRTRFQLFTYLSQVHP